MQETIYVRLVGEGVEVWRPVLAVKRSSPNSYLILDSPSNTVPETESWEFNPGTLVLVKEITIEGKKSLAAIEAFGR